MTRYPLQPLLDLSGLSMASLRELCPMSGQTYRNARTIGLTEDQADRWSCKVGLVPWLVWPHWLEDAQVECPECGDRFVQRRKDQVYCTPRCGHRRRQREAVRRRYAEDPEWRETKKARVRQYRAENNRAVKVQQAAWRDANRERRRAQQRAYYAANRERILARQRDYDRRRREQAA